MHYSVVRITTWGPYITPICYVPQNEGETVFDSNKIYFRYKQTALGLARQGRRVVDWPFPFCSLYLFASKADLDSTRLALSFLGLIYKGAKFVQSVENPRVQCAFFTL